MEKSTVGAAAAEHLGVESFCGGGVSKVHRAAGFGAFAGAQMGPNVLGAGQDSLHQGFHVAAAVFAAKEPGFDDLGVVEHQQVPR